MSSSLSIGVLHEYVSRSEPTAGGTLRPSLKVELRVQILSSTIGLRLGARYLAGDPVQRLLLTECLDLTLPNDPDMVTGRSILLSLCERFA